MEVGRPAARPFVEDKRRRRGKGGGHGHFNPSQPRGAHGRWVNTGATKRKPLAMGWPGGKRMKAFAEHALANKQSERRLFFGHVSNIGQVNSSTGHDVTGWKRKLTSDHLRKVIKSHGDQAKEAARSPVHSAVVPSDFKRLRSIVEKPDRVGRGGKTNLGLDSILYEKRIGGFRYFVLEEMQPKHKGLVVKTMYKHVL